MIQGPYQPSIAGKEGIWSAEFFFLEMWLKASAQFKNSISIHQLYLLVWQNALLWLSGLNPDLDKIYTRCFSVITVLSRDWLGRVMLLSFFVLIGGFSLYPDHPIGCWWWTFKDPLITIKILLADVEVDSSNVSFRVFYGSLWPYSKADN